MPVRCWGISAMKSPSPPQLCRLEDAQCSGSRRCPGAAPVSSRGSANGPCVVDGPGQVGERESDVVGVVGPVERAHLVLRHLRRDVGFLGCRGHDVEDGRDGDGAGVAGELWDVLLWRDWTMCRKSLVAADESVPRSKCL